MVVKTRHKIRNWYQSNKRSLPWRESSDAYCIWVSEIILQQTRVDQGLNYYLRFIENFPNLESLALAEEKEVLKVWEGLGYYSRARNMHATSKKIQFELGGKFPDSYDKIIELKGVGPYTAAAISSIVFNEPRAVLDGNVHRVLSRFYGIEEVPNGYRRSSQILAAAEDLIDSGDPGTHNQALMELGALVCIPVSPDCLTCPLKSECIAFKEHRVSELPLRARTLKKRIRHFHYLVIEGEKKIWINHRKQDDIWKGLYELPLIETEGSSSLESLIVSRAWSILLGNNSVPSEVSSTIKHILSHQEIYAIFYHIPMLEIPLSDDYIKVDISELDSYPVPKLIGNYLKNFID